MRFTKSDIEEIARRIAVITKRDSDLPDVDIPLHDNERVPVIQYIPLVQDYENRLLSLADLRSLVLADTDQTSVACVLSVICDTEGASVSIKGKDRTEYTGYYGEMVDVIISAEGYDTWIGVVTMTQDHTLVVSLNKKGSGGTVDDQCYVKVNNDQGARITLNGDRVFSGVKTYFPKGYGPITIAVELSGCKSDGDVIVTLDSDYENTFDLKPDEVEPDKPFIRFGNDTVTLKDGIVEASVDLLSNIDWTLIAVDDASPESADPDNASADLPDTISVASGDTSDYFTQEDMKKYTLKSKNANVATVDSDNNITGVSPGTTTIEAYDENGVFRKSVAASVVSPSAVVEPTGIEFGPEVPNVIELTMAGNTSIKLNAIVLPEGADQTVRWLTGYEKIAKVSQTGTLTVTGDIAGETYVQIATADKKYKARRPVIVKAAGTYVESLNPSVINNFPAEGGVRTIKYTRTVIGSATNLTEKGDPGFYVSRTGESDFDITVQENFGNARTIKRVIYGAFSGDNGKALVVNQEASVKASKLTGHGFSYVDADGKAEIGPDAGWGDLGNVRFDCGVGQQDIVVAGMSVVTGSDWIEIDEGSVELSDLYGYSAEQQREYKEYGTIDGKVPVFNGKVAEYSVHLNCAKNETGQIRYGSISLPGLSVTHSVTQYA